MEGQRTFTRQEKQEVFTFFQDVLHKYKDPVHFENIRGHVPESSLVVKRFVLVQCKGDKLLDYFKLRKNYFAVEDMHVSLIKKTALQKRQTSSKKINSKENHENRYVWKNTRLKYNSGSFSSNVSESTNDSESNSISEDPIKFQYEELTHKYFSDLLTDHEPIPVNSISFDSLPKKVKWNLTQNWNKKLRSYFSHFPDKYYIDADQNVSLCEPNSVSQTDISSLSNSLLDCSKTTMDPNILKANNYLDSISFFVSILEKKQPVNIETLGGYLSQASKEVRDFIKFNYKNFKLFIKDVHIIFILTNEEEITLSKNYKTLIRCVKSVIYAGMRGLLQSSWLKMDIDSILLHSLCSELPLIQNAEGRLLKFIFTIELLCLEMTEKYWYSYAINQAKTIYYFIQALKASPTQCLTLPQLLDALVNAPSEISSFVKKSFKEEQIKQFFLENNEFQFDDTFVILAPNYRDVFCDNISFLTQFHPETMVWNINKLYKTNLYVKFLKEAFAFVHNVYDFIGHSSTVKPSRLEGVLLRFPNCYSWIKAVDRESNPKKIEHFLRTLSIFEISWEGYISFPQTMHSNILFAWLRFMNNVYTATETDFVPSDCYRPFSKFVKNNQDMDSESNFVCKEIDIHSKERLKTIVNSVVKRIVLDKSEMAYYDLANIFPRDFLIEIVNANKDSRFIIESLFKSKTFVFCNGKIKLADPTAQSAQPLSNNKILDEIMKLFKNFDSDSASEAVENMQNLEDESSLSSQADLKNPACDSKVLFSKKTTETLVCDSIVVNDNINHDRSDLNKIKCLNSKQNLAQSVFSSQALTNTVAKELDLGNTEKNTAFEKGRLIPDEFSFQQQKKKNVSMEIAATANNELVKNPFIASKDVPVANCNVSSLENGEKILNGILTNNVSSDDELTPSKFVMTESTRSDKDMLKKPLMKNQSTNKRLSKACFETETGMSTSIEIEPFDQSFLKKKAEEEKDVKNISSHHDELNERDSVTFVKIEADNSCNELIKKRNYLPNIKGINTTKTFLEKEWLDLLNGDSKEILPTDIHDKSFCETNNTLAPTEHKILCGTKFKDARLLSEDIKMTDGICKNSTEKYFEPKKILKDKTGLSNCLLERDRSGGSELNIGSPYQDDYNYKNAQDLDSPTLLEMKHEAVILAGEIFNKNDKMYQNESVPLKSERKEIFVASDFVNFHVKKIDLLNLTFIHDSNESNKKLKSGDKKSKIHGVSRSNEISAEVFECSTEFEKNKNETSIEYPLQPIIAKVVLLTSDSCIAVANIKNCKQNIYFLKCAFNCDDPDCTTDCFEKLRIDDSVSCFVPPTEIPHKMWVAFMASKESLDRFKEEIELVSNTLISQTKNNETVRSVFPEKSCVSMRKAYTDLTGDVKLCEATKDFSSQTISTTLRTVEVQSENNTVSSCCQTDVSAVLLSWRDKESQTEHTGDIKGLEPGIEVALQTEITGEVHPLVHTIHSESQTISTGPVMVTKYYHH